MQDEEEPKRSSRKPILIVAGAVIAVIVIAFIGIQFSTTSDSGTSDAGPTSVDEQQVVIDIKSYVYHPSDISVPRGAEVTWINDDNLDHTATEKDSNAWNTQIIHSGGSFEITFESPGTFTYYCTIHPFMVATLTVR